MEGGHQHVTFIHHFSCPALHVLIEYTNDVRWKCNFFVSHCLLCFLMKIEKICPETGN